MKHRINNHKKQSRMASDQTAALLAQISALIAEVKAFSSAGLQQQQQQQQESQRSSFPRRLFRPAAVGRSRIPEPLPQELLHFHGAFPPPPQEETPVRRDTPAFEVEEISVEKFERERSDWGSSDLVESEPQIGVTQPYSNLCSESPDGDEFVHVNVEAERAIASPSAGDENVDKFETGYGSFSEDDELKALEHRVRLLEDAKRKRADGTLVVRGSDSNQSSPSYVSPPSPKQRMHIYPAVDDLESDGNNRGSSDHAQTENWMDEAISNACDKPFSPCYASSSAHATKTIKVNSLESSLHDLDDYTTQSTSASPTRNASRILSGGWVEHRACATNVPMYAHAGRQILQLHFPDFDDSDSLPSLDDREYDRLQPQRAGHTDTSCDDGLDQSDEYVPEERSSRESHENVAEYAPIRSKRVSTRNTAWDSVSDEDRPSINDKRDEPSSQGYRVPPGILDVEASLSKSDDSEHGSMRLQDRKGQLFQRKDSPGSRQRKRSHSRRESDAFLKKKSEIKSKDGAAKSAGSALKRLRLTVESTNRTRGSPSDHGALPDDVLRAQLAVVEGIIDACIIFAMSVRLESTGIAFHPQSVLCAIMNRAGGSLSSYLSRGTGILWGKWAEVIGSRERSWFCLVDNLDKRVIARAREIILEQEPHTYDFVMNASSAKLGISEQDAPDTWPTPVGSPDPACSRVDSVRIEYVLERLFVDASGREVLGRKKKNLTVASTELTRTLPPDVVKAQELSKTLLVDPDSSRTRSLGVLLAWTADDPDSWHFLGGDGASALAYCLQSTNLAIITGAALIVNNLALLAYNHEEAQQSMRDGGIFAALVKCVETLVTETLEFASRAETENAAKAAVEALYCLSNFKKPYKEALFRSGALSVLFRAAVQKESVQALACDAIANLSCKRCVKDDLVSNIPRLETLLPLMDSCDSAVQHAASRVFEYAVHSKRSRRYAVHADPSQLLRIRGLVPRWSKIVSAEALTDDVAIGCRSDGNEETLCKSAKSGLYSIVRVLEWRIENPFDEPWAQLLPPIIACLVPLADVSVDVDSASQNGASETLTLKEVIRGWNYFACHRVFGKILEDVLQDALAVEDPNIVDPTQLCGLLERLGEFDNEDEQWNDAKSFVLSFVDELRDSVHTAAKNKDMRDILLHTLSTGLHAVSALEQDLATIASWTSDAFLDSSYVFLELLKRCSAAVVRDLHEKES